MDEYQNIEVFNIFRENLFKKFVWKHVSYDWSSWDQQIEKKKKVVPLTIV